ncbi:MAG: TPM domain-containing protein [Luteolibacter sp.]
MAVALSGRGATGPWPGDGRILRRRGSLPRPAFNVQDDAGLFTRNPEGLRVISDRLRSLEKKHNFRMYVLIESVVIGTTPVDLAARLQQIWLPDGDGVVIVYEVDTRAFGMGRPYDAGDVTRPGKGVRIPSFVAAGAVERIRDQLSVNQRETASDLGRPARPSDLPFFVRIRDLIPLSGAGRQPEPRRCLAGKILPLGVACCIGRRLVLWFSAVTAGAEPIGRARSSITSRTRPATSGAPASGHGELAPRFHAPHPNGATLDSDPSAPAE